MQITETNAEGLKHEFTVTVEARDIEQRMQARLTDIGRQVRLPGFRPGKVPLGVLRKRYGTSVMGEVLERVVNDSSAAAMRERNLRPALQPKVEILSFDEGKDLSYKMAVEVLPEIGPMSFAELKLERLKPEVPEAEIDGALERIAQGQRKSQAVERAAERGDIILIDFVGSIGGEEFAGGKAENYRLELGSQSFIPGFEDQLVGAKAGEAREVKVTFPKDYGSDALAGRDAVFAVTVKEVQSVAPQPVDDSLASAIGMENLAALREAVRERIERDYAGLARQRLKRALLDALAERHHFAVPQGMVDIEFDVIWKQFEAERERERQAGAASAAKPGEEAKPAEAKPAENDEEPKAEYRAIAERRVRLGLLLSEVGRNNNITITADELNRAVAEEARRYPGQERKVIEYYRNNPQAADSLRAPIYEDKVVDFILELAQVSERSVPVAELIADTEDEIRSDAAAPAAD